LQWVGDAAGERGFGELLAARVAQGACGQLLGPGDAGRAVAPGRPQRCLLGRFAVVQFGAGQGLRPPGQAAGVLLPGVQPSADATDRRRVPVDGDAVAEGESEQRERPGDYLYLP
jgi:hypothetical protein